LSLRLIGFADVPVSFLATQELFGFLLVFLGFPRIRTQPFFVAEALAALLVIRLFAVYIRILLVLGLLERAEERASLHMRRRLDARSKLGVCLEHLRPVLNGHASVSVQPALHFLDD